MNKSIFTLALLLGLCFSQTSLAQDGSYIPFVEKGKVWQMAQFSSAHTMGALSPYEEPEFFTYTFKQEDGISVDGKEYLLMVQSEEEGYTRTVGYFREENKKVYMLNRENNQEHIVYDFTLNEGDKEDVYSMNEYVWADCTVANTSYVTLAGNDHKSIGLTSNALIPEDSPIYDDAAYTNARNNYWIEGIGNAGKYVVDYTTREGRVHFESWYGSPFTNLNLGLVPGGAPTLMCYTYSDSQFIPLEVNDLHFHGLEVVLGEELKTSAPEYQEWTKNNADDLLDYEFVSGYLHIYGYVNSSNAVGHYVFVQDDEEHKITLDFVDVGNKNGGTSINKVDFMVSGFNPGDYTIVHAGKEVKLTCTESAIAGVQQAQNPSPLYDLQGRRLLAAPQKGIYIENGRKIMK